MGRGRGGGGGGGRRRRQQITVHVSVFVLLPYFFLFFLPFLFFFFKKKKIVSNFGPVYMWIMDPPSRAPKKNTSPGNEVLPQNTAHLLQRPCYQRGGPCQDPAGNWTTWRSSDDRKKTQTAVVWSCFPFIRSGQNHLARHSESGEEDKVDKGRGGKTTSGNGQAWSSASPRGQWRTGEKGENWLQNHLWCPNDPRG